MPSLYQQIGRQARTCNVLDKRNKMQTYYLSMRFFAW